MSIIKVENLSKKYTIGHDRNAGGACRYSSLRDSIAHTTRGIYQRLRHPLSPNRENTELEEFWALKDINFEIKQGDRVGIIGRNGAGKSTLLKILSRITEPTTGKITIGGRVASLLEVGTGFHPELSGRENVYLNGAVLGMTRIEIKKKFDEIVDFSGVEKFLDTPVKRYSSGMYVRLAFAVAAHLEPEILLVDEVLAVGDAEFQKKCLGKMEEVSNEGRTVLFVSHNMNAIQRLCKKSILLSNGKLIKIGNSQEIIGSYLDIYDSKSGAIKWHKGLALSTKSDIRFFSIKTFSQAGVPTSDFLRNETIKLEIEYKIYRTLVNPQIGFYISHTSNCNLTFQSYEVDNKENRTKRLPGSYKSTCEIPANLLNTGKYYISVYAEVDNTIQVRDLFILKINIKNVDSEKIRPCNGTIRPILQWSIESTSSQ